MFDSPGTAVSPDGRPPTPAAAGDPDLAGLVAGLESVAAQLCAADPGAVGAGVRLEVVGRALGAVDRVMAAVVALVGAAGADPATLGAAGLTLPAWLRALAGRTSGVERMLLAAAERLAHLPVVAGLFTEGRLSWGVVRAVVSATKVLNREQLAWLDAAVAANRARLVAMGPDEVVTAVDELVEVPRPELVEDRADRRYERRLVQVQPGLDGSLALYTELDAEAGAVVLEALETTAGCDDAPDRDHEAAGDDPGTDQTGSPGGDAAAPPPEREPRARGRARADALVALCHRRTAGYPARPSLLVVTDVDTLAADGVASQAAHLLWRGNRGPVRVTAEAPAGCRVTRTCARC